MEELIKPKEKKNKKALIGIFENSWKIHNFLSVDSRQGELEERSKTAKPKEVGHVKGKKRKREKKRKKDVFDMSFSSKAQVPAT